MASVFDVFDQLENEAARRDEMRLRLIGQATSAQTSAAIQALDVVARNKNVVIDDAIETQKRLGELNFTAEEYKNLGMLNKPPSLPDTYNIIKTTEAQLKQGLNVSQQRIKQLDDAYNAIAGDVTQGLDYLEKAATFESELDSIQKNLKQVLPFIYDEFVKSSDSKSAYDDYLYNEEEMQKLFTHLEEKSGEVGFEQFEGLTTNETKQRVVRDGIIEASAIYGQQVKTAYEIIAAKEGAQDADFKRQTSKLLLQKAVSEYELFDYGIFSGLVKEHMLFSKERKGSDIQSASMILANINRYAGSMAINVVDIDTAKDRLSDAQTLVKENIPAQYQTKVLNQITNLLASPDKTVVATNIANLFIELGNVEAMARKAGDTEGALKIGQLGNSLIGVFQAAGVEMDSTVMLEIAELQSTLNTIEDQILEEDIYLGEITDITNVLEMAQQFAGVHQATEKEAKLLDLKEGDLVYNEVEYKHVSMALSKFQEEGIQTPVDPMLAAIMLEEWEKDQKEKSLDDVELNALIGFGTLHYDAVNDRYINIATGDLFQSDGVWFGIIKDKEDKKAALENAGYIDPLDDPDRDGILGTEGIDYNIVNGKAVHILPTEDPKEDPKVVSLKTQLLAVDLPSNIFESIFEEGKKYLAAASEVQTKIDDIDELITTIKEEKIETTKWLDEMYAMYLRKSDAAGITEIKSRHKKLFGEDERTFGVEKEYYAAAGIGEENYKMYRGKLLFEHGYVEHREQMIKRKKELEQDSDYKVWAKFKSYYDIK